MGQALSGVTLVGGGPVAIPVLKAALNRAPRVVAADSGADLCLAQGLRPERVTGDMDSIGAEARAAFADVLDPVAEQDSTDFEKALRGLVAPVVIGVGFLGARVDHALAVFSHLAQRDGPPVVLVSGDDCVLICPPDVTLDMEAGDRVSLWPLGAVAAVSEGLEWPVEGVALHPAGRVGTSNRATGGVRLRCEGPCLLIVGVERLDVVLAGLGVAG